jgi:uncharacterized protein YjbI with pentapeptide repeats
MPSSACLFGRWRHGWDKLCLLPGLLSILLGAWSVRAEACQLLPPPPEIKKVYWVHVEGPCLPEERKALAVKGAEILQALENGKSIDFDGVLVVDAVMLDLLPLHEISQHAGIPPVVRDRLQQRHIESVHMIPGSLSIRHSKVEKVLATNLLKNALLVLGAVDLTGTVFEQSVDFSKTVFVKPLTLDQVRVDFEAFFIDAEFHQPVDFSDVTFGTHSRFHSAVFHGPVTFADATFTGVAEFLEVEFHQGANIARAVFSAGAGFSGSVFNGLADFSNVTFEHEIYFRFTKFTEAVSFQGAQFHSVVDFTNARFDGEQDFSGAVFQSPPEFTGSNISLEKISTEGWRRHFAPVGIFAGLVVIVVFYFWSFKGKKEK